jgi:hypothetical protein
VVSRDKTQTPRDLNQTHQPAENPTRPVFHTEGADAQPAVTSQPKAAAAPAKQAQAPAAAREVPGSKPKGRGAAEGAARGSRGGYYSRGGPRNVLKTEGGATEAGAGAVDPDSGFEGERRG